MISAKELKSLLAKYGVRPSKRLGQNFLIDPNAASRILSAIKIEKHDLVVEIGPGLGQLTQGLCEKARKVIAVEIDKRLCLALGQTMAGCANFELANKDFLKFDIAGAVSDKGAEKAVIYGNVPYYITSPILVKLLENKKYIRSVYLLVQKEVANRLAARPGTGDYGSISCLTQYHSRPKMLFDVHKGAFYPQPEVDSTFLELEILASPSVSVENEEMFFDIIRASFQQRRKTLANALSGSAKLGLKKDQALGLLEKAGIDPGRRGETLCLEEFARIADRR